jgi:predicted transcriptional regulator
MARTTDRTVVLLSIKPKFADAIMAGEKRVEFRRVRCRPDVKVVLVYATSPVQRLVGYFDVAFIDESSPEGLWRRYGAVGGISQDEYQRYYAGAQTAIAIGVGKVHRLPGLCRLRQLSPTATPPQSFHYFPLQSLDRLEGARVG